MGKSLPAEHPGCARHRRKIRAATAARPDARLSTAAEPEEKSIARRQVPSSPGRRDAPARAAPGWTAPSTPLRAGLGGCPLMSVSIPSTAQHITPISIIEMPMVLRMSTRSRSLFGRPSPRDHIFLQAKQQPKSEESPRRADRCPRNLRRRIIFLPQVSRPPAQTKFPREKETAAPGRFRPAANTYRTCPAGPRRRARIVTMGLEHQHAR